MAKTISLPLKGKPLALPELKVLTAQLIVWYAIDSICHYLAYAIPAIAAGQPVGLSVDSLKTFAGSFAGQYWHLTGVANLIPVVTLIALHFAGKPYKVKLALAIGASVSILECFDVATFHAAHHMPVFDGMLGCYLTRFLYLMPAPLLAALTSRLDLQTNRKEA